MLRFKEFIMTEKRIYEWGNTQIIIPFEISSKIISFAYSIPDEEIYTVENDETYGREENSHITLRYGTDAKDASQLQEMKAYFPVDISFGMISAFESEEYDVLKISIDSPDLHKANKAIGTMIDFPGETFTDYQPHATIAYLKKGFISRYVGSSEFQTERFQADSFVLVNRMGKTIKI